MGFRSWLSSRIDPWERAAEEVAIAEASPLGLQGEIDPDPHLWRPLSGQPDRALPQVTQERAAELSFYAWQSNPLGYRLVELTAHYVYGDGIRLRAADDSVQAALDRFWDDPVNKMDKRMKGFVRSLSIFGEVILPVFKGGAGKVRIGYIDPSKVAAVVLDEHNALEIDRIAVRQGKGDSKPQMLKAVRWDDDAGRRVGDVAYWSVNRAPNSSRGRSDLLPVVDWLDGLDTFLISALDRIQIQNSVAWDLVVDGANQQQLKELVKKIPPPRPNMIRAHNNRTKWTAISPNIDGGDLTEFGKMLKVWIGTGMGFPPHWLGEPGDSNRATASESGAPVTESLRGRQDEVRCLVHDLLEFVLDEAIEAGQIDADVDRTFEVVMSTIWASQTDRIATATQSLAFSLASAEESGWITNGEAGSIFRHAVAQIGIDLEAVDEGTGEREDAQQAAARAKLLGVI